MRGRGSFLWSEKEAVQKGYRPAKIDLLAKAVGDFALFQNLQQEMHDIRMSLFDLIEEHN